MMNGLTLSIVLYLLGVWPPKHTSRRFAKVRPSPVLGNRRHPMGRPASSATGVPEDAQACWHPRFDHVD